MSDVLKQQKFDFIITVRYSYEFYDKEMMAGLSWPFSDYLIYISLRRRALYQNCTVEINGMYLYLINIVYSLTNYLKKYSWLILLTTKPPHYIT